MSGVYRDIYQLNLNDAEYHIMITFSFHLATYMLKEQETDLLERVANPNVITTDSLLIHLQYPPTNNFHLNQSNCVAV